MEKFKKYGRRVLWTAVVLALLLLPACERTGTPDGPGGGNEPVGGDPSVWRGYTEAYDLGGEWKAVFSPLDEATGYAVYTPDDYVRIGTLLYENASDYVANAKFQIADQNGDGHSDVGVDTAGGAVAWFAFNPEDVGAWPEKLGGCFTYLQTVTTRTSFTGNITFAVVAQEYTDDMVAEVLNLKADGENSEIAAINASIMEGPLMIYGGYVKGVLPEDTYASDMELRSYPFQDDEWAQIVTGCIAFPETRPDLLTRMWSWNFNKAENKWVTLDDMLSRQGLTRDGVAGAFLKAYEPEEWEEATDVEVTGFFVGGTHDGDTALHLLLEVWLEAESDPYKSFCLYTPDSGEFENLPAFGVMFDPEVYDMVSLPESLAYEWEPYNLASLPAVWINGTDLEEIDTNEYLFEGMVHYLLEDYYFTPEDAYDEESIMKRIVDLQEYPAREMSAMLSEELSAQLTYPCWQVQYTTGGNEDTRVNMDFYFQTDTSEHRVHICCPIDFYTEYQDEIISRAASIELID